MPNLQLSEKLEPFLYPKKFKVAYGGRGGGKSMAIADILLMRVMSEGLKVGAMRELMNSIDDSVHSLFVAEIDRLGLQGFTIQNNAIYHESGGEIKYKGLARNPESVKSMHGFSVFWVEEASTLSKKSIDLLIPTLRAEGSELWLTFNPCASVDPVYQEFIKPFDRILKRDGCYMDDLYTVIKCNYLDNPWFPYNLEQLRMQHKEIKSSAEYDHTWMGECSDYVDNSIIKAEWFDSALDAHKLGRLKEAFKPKGIIVATLDPMDGGKDAHGYACRHGSIIKEVRCKDSGEIDVGCRWAMDLAKKGKADWFVWDGDGVGTGLRYQVSDEFDGSRVDYHMFKGSLSGSGQDNADIIYDKGDSSKSSDATYADTFKNNRAQYYAQLSKRFYATYRCVVKGEYVDPDQMISIDTAGVLEAERLRSELCRIPRKENNTGLYQIMSKQDMRRLGIESPNMADCIMMSMWGPKIKKKRANQATPRRRA